VASFLPAIADVPVDPEFVIHRPANTGIPGLNNVLFTTFGPDGRLWTGARDFFWQVGGVAAFDRETGLWETHSSDVTPLAQWNYSVDFADDGSVWISSDDRVNHFDGESFTVYDQSNSILPTGPFLTVDVAPNGHVWASNAGQVSVGGGLFEFNGTEWIRHQEDWMVAWTGFGPAPAVNVIARQNGQVWSRLDVVGGGLGKYEDGEWTRMIGQPQMIDFVESPEGVMYAVDAFATWRYNDETESWDQIGPNGSSIIALDKTNGYLFVKQDYQTVAKWDGTSWSTFASFPGTVGSIDVAPDGSVWISAEVYASVEVIHHMSADGEFIRGYNSVNTGVPDYLLSRLYRDKDGYMWFISEEYGATRLEENENYRNFGSINMGEEPFPFDLGGPSGLLAEGVSNVFQDSQGNVWLTGNGAARSNGSDLSQWNLWYWETSILPSGFLTPIGEDPEGNIYIGGDFVAFRFDGADWSTVVVGNPTQFAVIGFHNGMDGELYAYRIGTIYHMQGGVAQPILSIETNVLDMAVEPDGDIWIATTQGLKYWNGSTMTTYTPGNTALAYIEVAEVELREDGLVAAVSSQLQTLPYDGGIALFDGDTWTAYNYGESGLPFYSNGALTFDAVGNLWIACLNYGAVEIVLNDTSEPGDLDGDGDIDLVDFAGFQLCFTGPGGTISGDPCGAADFDGDGDCDLVDFNAFQLAFTGAL
jgi:hypothetical protein